MRTGGTLEIVERWVGKNNPARPSVGMCAPTVAG